MEDKIREKILNDPKTLDQINFYLNLQKQYQRRKNFVHLKIKQKYPDNYNLLTFVIHCAFEFKNYTEKEIETLYESLLSMPPEAAKAFKILSEKYLEKASKKNNERSINFIEYMIKSWNKTRNLENKIITYEDEVNFYKERDRKSAKKTGIFTPYYKGINLLLSENPYLKQKDAVIIVFNKYFKDNKNIKKFNNFYQNYRKFASRNPLYK